MILYGMDTKLEIIREMYKTVHDKRIYWSIKDEKKGVPHCKKSL